MRMGDPVSAFLPTADELAEKAGIRFEFVGANPDNFTEVLRVEDQEWMGRIWMDCSYDAFVCHTIAQLEAILEKMKEVQG